MHVLAYASKVINYSVFFRVPVLPFYFAVFVRAVPLPEQITASFLLASSKETACSLNDVAMCVVQVIRQRMIYVLGIKQCRIHKRRQEEALSAN